MRDGNEALPQETGEKNSSREKLLTTAAKWFSVIRQNYETNFFRLFARGVTEGSVFHRKLDIVM